MQIELKRLQHEVGITFVVVTHDQEEALVMADRMAVLRDGRLLQCDTPHEIYERPADRFVADFIGVMNFCAGVAARRGWREGSRRFDYRGLAAARARRRRGGDRRGAAGADRAVPRRRYRQPRRTARSRRSPITGSTCSFISARR